MSFRLLDSFGLYDPSIGYVSYTALRNEDDEFYEIERFKTVFHSLHNYFEIALYVDTFEEVDSEYAKAIEKRRTLGP